MNIIFPQEGKISDLQQNKTYTYFYQHNVKIAKKISKNYHLNVSIFIDRLTTKWFSLHFWEMMM